MASMLADDGLNALQALDRSWLVVNDQGIM
jgi:hypothetical protein